MAEGHVLCVFKPLRSLHNLSDFAMKKTGSGHKLTKLNAFVSSCPKKDAADFALPSHLCG